MCSKRKSSAEVGRSGRMSCFWVSVVRCEFTSGRTASTTSSFKAGRMKFSPITDAGSITARWSSPSSSSRSVRSASIDPGRASPSDRSLVARQPFSSSTSSCSSTSIETSCSTKSGLPSAASTIRPRTASGTATVPRTCSITRLASSSPSGASSTVASETSRQSRRSRRSGRVAHRTSSGAPSMVVRRCAIRSRSVASAQWMSSKRSASGRSDGDALQQLPHAPEELRDREVAVVQSPTAAATRSITAASPPGSRSSRARRRARPRPRSRPPGGRSRPAART